MKLAVITAYSPRFRRVAQLCTPSQKSLAARAGAEFFELPFPDDGKHRWRKISLVQEWLTNWHSVLWLDADCIVSSKWTLPAYRGQMKHFFPWAQQSGQRYALTFAMLWINSPESFDLLGRMATAPGICSRDEITDQQALNFVLAEDPRRKAFVGNFDSGLVHHAGLDIWEKQLKLRNQTIS